MAQNFVTKIFYCTFSGDLGVAGLRPNFFSSGRIFLAELAQESWRDLAAVVYASVCPHMEEGGFGGKTWKPVQSHLSNIFMIANILSQRDKGFTVYNCYFVEGL